MYRIFGAIHITQIYIEKSPVKELNVSRIAAQRMNLPQTFGKEIIYWPCIFFTEGNTQLFSNEK